MTRGRTLLLLIDIVLILAEKRISRKEKGTVLAENGRARAHPPGRRAASQSATRPRRD